MKMLPEGKRFKIRYCSSVCIESACSAGDPGSILWGRRFAGEGIGCPLQYSWTSLMTQTVKNPPTMQETWVWSLGWEDPLEKAMAPHSSTLAWKIPWTEDLGRLQSMGLQRVGHDWAASLSQWWHNAKLFPYKSVYLQTHSIFHLVLTAPLNLEKQYRALLAEGSSMIWFKGVNYIFYYWNIFSNSL